MSPSTARCCSRRPTARAETCLATDRWVDRPVLRLFATRSPASARRRALPATERAARGQGGRGHRLLSLRPAAVAQRRRLRCRALRARRRGVPCPRAARAAGHPHGDAGDRHARPQARRGCARAPRGAERAWPANGPALQARWVEASAPLRTDGAPDRRRHRDAAADDRRRLAARSRSRRYAPAAPPSPTAGGVAAEGAARGQAGSDWAAVDEAYEDAARRFPLALIAEAALPICCAEIAPSSAASRRPAR